MTVRLRFFAMLRERAGTADAVRELDRPITVGELWREVQAELPGLRGYAGPVRFAVDEEYVDSETLVSDNAEVAFIPPVSGG